MNELKTFVESIRNHLPDAAEKTDNIMIGLGFEKEDEVYALWVESLAEVTNTLMRQRDQREVEKHLKFFCCQWDTGSDTVKNFIDVCYIENLMRSLEKEDKKWAWPLFPENLKSLYIAVQGEPD